MTMVDQDPKGSGASRRQSIVIRLVVLIILIALLAGNLHWYYISGPNPAMGHYPTGGHQLNADYDRYIGERFILDGEVVDTDPVVVRYGPADDPGLLTVTGLSTQPERGDRLRIFGIVRPNHTIEAINVVNLSQRRSWYVESVSLLAGIWVLGRILNHWRLDTHDLTLRPRAETWLEARREADDA